MDRKQTIGIVWTVLQFGANLGVQLSIQRWADWVPNAIIIGLWLFLLVPVAYLVYTSHNKVLVLARIKRKMYSNPIAAMVIGVATGVVITVGLVLTFDSIWGNGSTTERPNLTKQSESLPQSETTPLAIPIAAAATATEKGQAKDNVRETETPKSPPTVAEPRQPFVSAPHGIAIGGDNTGTATVNNYAPPNRRLTDAQISALNAVVASLAEDASEYIFVRRANDAETLKYSSDFVSIFKNHGKLKDKNSQIYIIA